MSLLQPPPGEPVVRLSSPPEIVRAVPQLLGFHPTASLVVLGLAGERHRLRMTLRVGLPAPGDQTDLAGYLAARMSSENVEACILVLFTEAFSASDVLRGRATSAESASPHDQLSVPLGDSAGKQRSGPRGRVTTSIRADGERARMPGGAAAMAVETALRSAGLEVPEVLRVEDGRWWSYACELSCCPPEGAPTGSGPTSLLEVLRVAAGRPVFADRTALVASVARAEDEPSPKLAAALRNRAELVAARRPSGRGVTSDLIGLQALLARAAGLLGPEFPTAKGPDERRPDERHPLGHGDETLAFAAVALRLSPIRDASFAWTGGPLSDAAIALWRELVRRVPPPYAAAPATLLAVAAYRRGDGAVADVYLRRALEDDPEYRMADLVLTSLEQGFHPADVEFALGLEEPEPDAARPHRSVRPHRVQGSRRTGGADAR